jgi:hypothetical protein
MSVPRADENTPINNVATPSFRFTLQHLSQRTELFEQHAGMNYHLIVSADHPPELDLQTVTYDVIRLEEDTRALRKRILIAEELDTTHRNIIRVQRTEESASREITQLKDKMIEIRSWITTMHNA